MLVINIEGTVYYIIPIFVHHFIFSDACSPFRSECTRMRSDPAGRGHPASAAAPVVGASRGAGVFVQRLPAGGHADVVEGGRAAALGQGAPGRPRGNQLQRAPLHAPPGGQRRRALVPGREPVHPGKRHRGRLEAGRVL